MPILFGNDHDSVIRKDIGLFHILSKITSVQNIAAIKYDINQLWVTIFYWPTTCVPGPLTGVRNTEVNNMVTILTWQSNRERNIKQNVWLKCLKYHEGKIQGSIRTWNQISLKQKPNGIALCSFCLRHFLFIFKSHHLWVDRCWRAVHWPGWTRKGYLFSHWKSPVHWRRG